MSICSIYVIATLRDGQPVPPVKVGISNNPESRFRSIQTASPMPITLYDAFRLKTTTIDSRKFAEDLEGWVHEDFANRHLHGEWFDVPPDEAVDHITFWLGFQMRLAGWSYGQINDYFVKVGHGPILTEGGRA